VAEFAPVNTVPKSEVKEELVTTISGEGAMVVNVSLLP
jgi:hypothetical protein